MADNFRVGADLALNAKMVKRTPDGGWVSGSVIDYCYHKISILSLRASFWRSNLPLQEIAHLHCAQAQVSLAGERSLAMTLYGKSFPHG
jgi:hypothetical protein